MELDFSKCKTAEDIKKVFKEHEEELKLTSLKELSKKVSTIGKIVALNSLS